MATEPDRAGALTTEAADGIVAGVHRYALAALAVNASQPTSHPPLAGLVPLRDGIAATMADVAGRLAGQPGSVVPDLRGLHAELVKRLHPTGAAQAGVAVVVGETDVMVDAVDTIAGLIAEPSAPHSRQCR